MSITEDFISMLLPDPAVCAERAAELRRAHPSLSPEDLARHAIKTSRRWASLLGAGSGAVANPIAMVPVTMTEIAAILKLEARLIGVVAAILEPTVLTNHEEFGADILANLFPAAASQALRTFGVSAGQQATKVLIRKYITKDVLRALVRFAAKYLGIKLTQKAILTKAVPVVGAGVGSIWNWIEVSRVAKRATKYYLLPSPPPAASPA